MKKTAVLMTIAIAFTKTLFASGDYKHCLIDTQLIEEQEIHIKGRILKDGHSVTTFCLDGYEYIRVDMTSMQKFRDTGSGSRPVPCKCPYPPKVPF